jgi:DNA-binding XRE family transcriptional regulator
MKQTLAEIRRSRGVTKGAMVNLLEVSYPTYQRYERDPGCMRVADLDKVCRFLHVRRDEIFLPRDLN